jgi:ABC-type dipeptide/oligopeptide/nickel transport system permease subunit
MIPCGFGTPSLFPARASYFFDPLRFWYTIVIPGACIILFVLAWNLIGDALRDAFDPKLRRR